MTSMSGHVRGRAASRILVEDHDCVGYPIAVHIGAAAVDVGSVVNPFIAGAYSLQFGRGHPLNATGALTPASELYLSPYATSAPSSGAVQRRAELLGALEALLAVKDLYGEQGVRAACAHVHTDSKYVAKVWGEWLDDWDKNGWPGEMEDDEPDMPERLGPPVRDSGIALSTGSSPSSRSSPLQQNVSSSSGSIRARSYSSFKRSSVAGSNAGSIKGAPSILSLTSDASITLGAPHLFTARGRPFDEDLMRDLADLRKHFGEVERSGRGGCYFYASTKAESPAHTTAREFARASGQEEFKNMYRGGKRSVRRKKIPGDGSSMMSVDSRASKASRATTATTRRGPRASNPPDMPPMPASPVPSATAGQREAKTSQNSVARSSSNESFASARAGELPSDAMSHKSSTGSMRSAKGRNASTRASRYQSTTSPVPESPASVTVALPPSTSQSASSVRVIGNARSSRRINGAPPTSSSRIADATAEEPEDEESRMRTEKFQQAQQAAQKRMTQITASPALSQDTQLWPEEERGRVIKDLEKGTPKKKKKGFFSKLFSRSTSAKSAS